MKKWYIIILVIAVVIAAGLYIYQGQKQAKDLNSHHNEQYNRIIEAAQKSSIAGLVHMGRALNKYMVVIQYLHYPTAYRRKSPAVVTTGRQVSDIAAQKFGTRAA